MPFPCPIVVVNADLIHPNLELVGLLGDHDQVFHSPEKLMSIIVLEVTCSFKSLSLLQVIREFVPQVEKLDNELLVSLSLPTLKEEFATSTSVSLFLNPFK